MVLTMLGGRDTKTLLDGEKIELHILAGGGNAKFFPIFTCLVPNMGHLVKGLLPNNFKYNLLVIDAHYCDNFI